MIESQLDTEVKLSVSNLMENTNYILSGLTQRSTQLSFKDNVSSIPGDSAAETSLLIPQKLRFPSFY